MNRLQQAQYNAYKSTLDHLAENEVIVKTIPIFLMIISSARALLDSIRLINKRQLEETGGPADQKEMDTVNLASMAHRISSILFTYASMKKDLELRKLMDYSMSKLKASPDDLQDISKNILDKAKERLSELDEFGITAALLDNFSRMIEDFEEVVLAPRNATAVRSDDNKRLKALLAETRHVFKEHIHRMMINFKDSHPEFYGQYKSKRVIVDPYTRHTRVSGTVTNQEGLPVEGAVVEVDGTGYRGVTDAEGKVDIKVPMTGKVVISVIKAGYVTVRNEKTLSKGKQTSFTVSVFPV